MTGILRNTPEPVSVSELSGKLKRTLEDSFDFVRVRGEISGLKIAGSGHIYMDLKDENSVLHTVCWKGVASKLQIKPSEGLEVICTGKITTYPSRSYYQLTMESMELAGQGALLKMLEDQRLRLEKEGLFHPSRKKPLPFLPRRIGIITSPTGAVIQDMLHRLRDRCPVHVILWPATVQGTNTVRDVTAGLAAFALLPADQRPDVIIIARGGGSFEDLVQFSNEDILRAVAACTIPVISAIGHETDTTQIDFVSDWRAPTPTAAAERAVPVLNDLVYTVGVHEQRLRNLVFNRLKHDRNEIRVLNGRLGDPRRLIDTQQQKLDFISLQADKAIYRHQARMEQRFTQVYGRLRHPDFQLKHAADRLTAMASRLGPSLARQLAQHDRLDALGQRLKPAVTRQINQGEKVETLDRRLRHAVARHIDQNEKLGMLTQRLLPLGQRQITQAVRHLENAQRVLESFSYKKTLARGFALVETLDGRVIMSADMARQQSTLKITFADDQSVQAVPDKA